MLGLAEGQANRLMIHGGMRYVLGGPKMAVQKLTNLEGPWPAARAADFKLLRLRKWGVREIRKRPRERARFGADRRKPLATHR